MCIRDSAQTEARLGVHPAQRCEEQRIGRSGQTAEFGVLRFVDIELGQPQRRESRHHEAEHAAAVAHPRFGIGRKRVVPQHEKHRSRNESERNHVGERIQLDADGRGALQQPGGEAVAIVEEARGDGEPERCV